MYNFSVFVAKGLKEQQQNHTNTKDIKTERAGKPADADRQTAAKRESRFIAFVEGLNN